MSAACAAPDTFNPDREIPVHDLGCIESVLDRMWKSGEESVQSDESGRAPVVRACLGNVIVIAPEADDAAISEILDKLSIRWPARMILVRVDPAKAGSEVLATVRAVCHLPQPGSPQVCCESIELMLGPEGTYLLPGIIGPLTEPDLPVFLWWAHPAAGAEPLLRKLMPLVGRLVIDQARPDGSHAFREWLAYGAGTGVVDLAWERTEPWRRALASVYEDPLLRPSLDRITGVNITAGTPGVPCSAEVQLMLGWLAGQLGWKVDSPLFPSEGGWRSFALSGGREIILRITPASTPVAGCGIGAITIDTADGSEVGISVDPTGARMMVSACDADTCRLRRSLPLPRRTPEGLLGSAILATPASLKVFERAARLALDLATGVGE